ncbi:MAG: S-layer protein, partial [Methanospirillum sp.]|uniref:COG1361 S-layer family protein n=1 Tax=Methanospirillum sp. TaxID=45200 RepID=UPI002373FB5B
SSITSIPGGLRNSQFSSGLLILAILIGLVCSPVSAGTKYLAGSPDISASISGNHDLTPGTTALLPVSIENTGLISSRMVESQILEQDDVPSTAKMVLVSLEAGDAPVLVKSDSQMLGDIAASHAKSATFQVRVKDDARAGKYTVPLHVRYTYLAEADQQGTESVTYRYIERDLILELPFVIKSAITLDVTDVTTDDINAGGSGYVLATLKNSGTDAGLKTVAKISRDDGSPVVPVDSAVYIGSFTPGETVQTKFKVSIANDAQQQKYPLNLFASYENADGETLNTPIQRVGIPVKEKIRFSVVSTPAMITSGGQKIIEVDYQNDGDSPVYKAEARITLVDPFTSNDALAYLGDIKPGEHARALFEISASDDADEKTYALDSEVRFRDALDISQTSDTVKVPITVTSSGAFAFITADPVAVLLLLVIIIGGGYYYFGVRRKIPVS